MYFLFAEFFVLKRSVQLRMRTLVYENIHSISVVLIMAALWNRADHYIFILFLLLFFPRLISAVGDWMFTILWHMVRI